MTTTTNWAALLSELLTTDLPEVEQQAFTTMLDQLHGGRPLSERQQKWVRGFAEARGVVAEEAQNLWSRGLVPQGIASKPTAGEAFAASVLSRRPLAPPGRRST